MAKNQIWHYFNEWLSANRRGWRCLVGFICVLCLSLFLHFREVRFEIPQLNTQASRYIIAQIDFAFPDHEMTIILKQQAMQDIGKIYQINAQEIRQVRGKFEEQLIHRRDWRRVLASSTFDEIYRAADEIESALLEERFTDVRTIQKLKALHMPSALYYEYTMGERDAPELPSLFWAQLESKVAADSAIPLSVVRYVIQFFAKNGWTLSEDTVLENSLRAKVSQMVPQKMSKVSAGTRILDPGELVTTRHVAMMTAMKKTLSEKRALWEPFPMFGSFLLSVIFVTISALYFRMSQPEFIRSLRQVSLFVCIVILTLGFAKFTEYILLQSASHWITAIRYPIVAPFATLLICILLSPRTALFAATFLSIIFSVSLAVDHSKLLILNLVTSIVVIIASRNLSKRKEVFVVCAKSWLSVIPVLYAYTLNEGQWGVTSFAIEVTGSFIFLFVTAIMVVGLLPILEMFFGVLTNMTLMEYMDPNNELLRIFSMEVPGTYQHSLVLGNLAEACAQAIHANGLFCRVATLYHDVGKMKSPQFYTENQQGIVNIHQLLTPKESAAVIISHVADGVAIAKEYRLPESLISIIQEHHGTTLAYYFYHKEMERLKGTKETVDEALFRYPGPKPHSKESAIIMICDSVEAASRSLPDMTEESIQHLVDTIVQEKISDHQLTECQLTFKELETIKKTLVQTLLVTHHLRIQYPKKPRS